MIVKSAFGATVLFSAVALAGDARAGGGASSGSGGSSCVCTKEYRPVCGKDGRQFGNACAARCAGVTDFTQGPCNTAPSCGGIAGRLCPKGLSCIKESKGIDATGRCYKTCKPGDARGCAAGETCEDLKHAANEGVCKPSAGAKPGAGSAFKLCGGIAALRCPDGSRCIIKAKHPDASGFCIPANFDCKKSAAKCPAGLSCEPKSREANAPGECR